MKALLQRWQAHREARVLARRAIPDGLWQLTLASLPFMAWRSAADQAELRRLASLFLDQKEFTGANGLVVDDAMAVHIAAQAVLPVLRFGLAPYNRFVGIVVQPDEVVETRMVRFRTLGCYPLTGAIESNATSLLDIVEEEVPHGVVGDNQIGPAVVVEIRSHSSHARF